MQNLPTVSNDINTTERSKLYSFISSNGFPQLINEPTHIQINSSLYIDLIFIDQPNLSVNSGVHASFHPPCYHQIVDISFNPICYPHHINVEYGYHKTSGSTNITKAFDSVNWAKFFDQRDINVQVSVPMLNYVRCFQKLCS